MKTKAWAASTGGAIAGMALFGGQAAADPPQASPSNGVIAAIQDGTLILEARARFESADQTGIADADAFTLRTRLGWETAAWHGIKGLIEFEDVRQLGNGDYNDGVPPIEPFATIADPDVTEINRAQLSWVVNPHLTLTGGRQRINLDDQRFVGGVAWRQDEQTFDAVRADVTFGGFRATYAYVDHVNRVFAEELDWDGPAHLLNASYTVSPAFKMTGFSYVLDFEEPAAAIAQSSSTTGLRASGQTTVEGIRLDYAASYANQHDYGDNPASFNLDYVGLELTATHGPFSGRIAYEELEGDGARGFSTPLATLHAFQGWADVFLTTPTDGLQDFNVTGTFRPTFSAPHLSNVALTLRWHDFEAERTSADLGEEVDFQASATLAPRVTALFKIADYDGEGAPADTTRTWVGLEFRL